MISSVPDLSGSTPETVQGARRARGEALQATNERFARRCFDDQVDVIGLHREVNHTKVVAVRAGKRQRERFEGGQRPKRGKLRPGADGHQNREARLVRGPRRVSLLRAKGRRLPSRAGSATSPGNGCWKPKLQLRTPCHLDWALFRRGAGSVARPMLKAMRWYGPDLIGHCSGEFVRSPTVRSPCIRGMMENACSAVAAGLKVDLLPRRLWSQPELRAERSAREPGATSCCRHGLGLR